MVLKAWHSIENHNNPIHMSEITIPKKLEPIVKAFCTNSPETTRDLILQAAKAIYSSGKDDDLFSFKVKYVLSKEELESVCSLMDGIKPIDTFEALIAAQIVASHLLGMRKLAQRCNEDQRIGLNMLRFSAEAINQLQKKRSGNTQNITVNYDHNDTKPAFA